MSKIKYSWLTKLIAWIVLVESLTGFTVFATFGIGKMIVQNDTYLQQDILDEIGENYACAVISTINEHPDNITNSIDDLLEDTRFKCAVLKSDTKDLKKVDLTDEALYVYGSPAIISSYTNTYWGHGETSYNYNLNSFMGAMRCSFYITMQDEKALEENPYYYHVISYVKPASKNSNCAPDNLGYWDEDVYETSSEYRNDLYHMADEAFSWFYGYADNADVFCIFFAIVALVSGAYLIWAAGHRNGRDEIVIGFLDRIPFGIYSAIAFGLLMFFACGVGFIEIINDYSQLLGIGTAIVTIMYVIATLYIATIVVRLKGKCFWRYTIAHYLFIPVKKILDYSRENLSLFKKVTLLVVGILAFIGITGIIALEISSSLANPIPAFLWLIIVLFELASILYRICFQLNRIKEGGERIASGKVDEPINTEGLSWELKKHAENLNSISQSIELAVSEKMKSERFKTELITNVSHDIKTPLTSIINYVDLMKKENITDPTLLEYMDVLDRQSSRLKKLIEDLMEASKASTGNLTVNLEECDVTVMLSQAVGEFEEKMVQKGLIPVITYPEEKVVLSADGRHLWRVFDNLLNNICKYAQPSTRVYINVDKNGQELNIIFKNISSSQLNISSEELMERFVRGDSSRNTEGSGLGLSIAKSLTELMNGRLELCVDGDLFKVTLVFPV